MIGLRKVSFSYSSDKSGEIETLLDADLSVVPSEILCVLGESGSGKTTLLNLLSGILSPTVGKVERGQAIISYLHQEDLLLPFRTVWQNTFLAAELQNALTENVFAKGHALLILSRLDAFRDRMPSELSGGMRRRVALIRQLLRRADVLLLDDPFASQDRLMRQTLEDAVYVHCRDQKKTAVIVTHDIDSAVAIGDRIVILDSQKQFTRAWLCPAEMAYLRPSQRRARADFTDHVSSAWREFWKATDHA